MLFQFQTCCLPASLIISLCILCPEEKQLLSALSMPLIILHTFVMLSLIFPVQTVLKLFPLEFHMRVFLGLVDSFSVAFSKPLLFSDNSLL